MAKSSPRQVGPRAHNSHYRPNHYRPNHYRPNHCRPKRLRALESLETRLALAVWFVDDSAAPGGTGQNWQQAFTNLQPALDVAAPADEIWMAAGTYLPTKIHFPPATPPPGTDPNTIVTPPPPPSCGGAETFLLPNGISILGGFAGNETTRNQRNPALNVTILDGGDGGSDQSAVTVVTILSGVTATIDGVTIDGGFGYGCGGHWKGHGGGLDVAGHLNLSNATIRSAHSPLGGGIYVSGSADLSHVTIRDSGGIGGGAYVAPGGFLSMADSRLDNNFSGAAGGGIFASASTLHIERTVFANNYSFYYDSGGGGGVYLERMIEATIDDSQFDGNWSSYAGYNSAQGQGGGGAIAVTADTTLRIAGTRFLANTASGPGGAIYNLATVSIVDSSLLTNNSSKSGGAIYSTGDLTIAESTVIGNRAGEGATGGGIAVAAGQLDLESVFISNNRTGENGQGGGLYLGGPTTNVPVIANIRDVTISGNDAGTQTGAGGGVYVGDAEPQSGQPLISESTIIGNTAGTNGGGIYAGDSAALVLYDTLLSSNEAASAGGGIFVASASPATAPTDLIRLEDVTLQGNTALYGAGLSTGQNRATELIDSRLSNNRAEGTDARGGGIYNDGGRLTLTSTELSTNTADQHGGAIYTEAGQLVLDDATLRENTSDASGGAIHSIETSIQINASRLNSNVSQNSGGGVYLQGGSLDVIDSSITSNKTTAAHGGGIYNQVADVSILRSTIDENRAAFGSQSPGHGGGIYNLDGQIEIRDSRITRNYANTEGGGIASISDAANTSLTIVGSTIANNGASVSAGNYNEYDAQFVGGAGLSARVTANKIATIDVRQSAINNNSLFHERHSSFGDAHAEAAGGGILVLAQNPQATVRLSIAESTLDGNRAAVRAGNFGLEGVADAYGGGIYFVAGAHDSRLSVVSSTISNNVAEALNSHAASAQGGGIYASANAGDVHVVQSTISGNMASVMHSDSALAQAGGLFFTGSETTHIRHSTIVNNRTRFLFNDASEGRGPGVFASAVEIGDSIITGNTVEGAPPAAEGEVAAMTVTSLGYNLVGIDEVGAFSGASDQTGRQSAPLDPLLGPLADNGGHTQTHRPLPDSPAIDSGNPNFIPEAYVPPLVLDQRGLPRVADGNADGTARIDRGAVEVASPTPLTGDLNHDGLVGLADLLALQKQLGTIDAVGNDADLNGDNEVNRADLAVLLANYGNRQPPVAAPSAAIVAATAPMQTTRRRGAVQAARPRLTPAAVDQSLTDSTPLQAHRSARRPSLSQPEA